MSYYLYLRRSQPNALYWDRTAQNWTTDPTRATLFPTRYGADFEAGYTDREVLVVDSEVIPLPPATPAAVPAVPAMTIRYVRTFSLLDVGQCTETSLTLDDDATVLDVTYRDGQVILWAEDTGRLDYTAARRFTILLTGYQIPEHSRYCGTCTGPDSRDRHVYELRDS